MSDSESTQAVELIPHVTQSFTVAQGQAAQQPPENPLGIYSSKDSNAILNKALRKSVSVVERRLTAVRSSFEAVEKIIGDETLQIRSMGTPDVSVLIEEWNDINMDFIRVVHSSQKVAMRGACMIEEFISTIIPYLCVDGDMEQKKKELRAYREGLHRGSKIADSFASELHKVSKRVTEYGRKWKAHSKAVVQQLEAQINKLQDGMTAIKESYDATNTKFSSIFAHAWYEESRPQPGTEKKKRRETTRDLKQVSKLQSRSEGKVSKHTHRIKENTEGLVAVWNLIYDDIGIIETQMCFTENSTLVEVFKKRVVRLSNQYIQLKISLESLGVAMACTDSPLSTSSGGLFRKLLTSFP